ncbi:MAG: acetylglutamate kinase [Polyangiaceae bacterium]|nr:acetylglutamate kinase [Polyangiaceae bacterium]
MSALSSSQAMHTAKDRQDVIVRLLANIGSRKEVEQYLRHYAAVDAPKFAVVKASGSIIESSLDALASSLSFLQKVGLVPIVVHGNNLQLDRALRAANIEVPIVNGVRTMTPAALEVARRVLHDTNLRIVDALESLGTRARPFTSGVLDVKKIDSPELGLTGEITNVRDTAVTQTARSGILPIVAPLGETSKGKILVVRADAVARALALALKPHKIVYLNESGGLVDESGSIRSAVNLEEDYDQLLSDARFGSESRRKIVEISSLLSELPRTSSVSITSPEHLAKELFTHRGHGTLVRRGERILHHEGWSTIDTARLRDLLEECFGRKLAGDYFESKAPYRVYLADSYRATAIFTLEDGVPYLDKFAVTSEAQGEGIGGSIWQRMRRENPKMFWRSRAQNPINPWYVQNADGLYKTAKWWVFWCGMTGFPEIQMSVERALAMEATFYDAPLSTPPAPPAPEQAASS